MNIIIEGNYYKNDGKTEYNTILPEKYIKENNKKEWKTECVGYYNDSNRGLTFILPKIFLKSHECFDCSQNITTQKNWPLTIYQVLKKYRKMLSSENSEKNTTEINTILSNKDENQHTLLDIMFGLINIHKENPFIYFKEKVYGKQYANKTDWKKTVRSSISIIDDGNIIYFDTLGRRSKASVEEKLLIIFYSTLYKISKEMNIRLEINDNIPILKNHKMKKFEKNIDKILKTSKYMYYTDLHKKIHYYLTEYYNYNSTSTGKKDFEEYLITTSFELVFESMVDLIVSDSKDLEHFKTSKDDKILDHIYHSDSFIEQLNINGKIPKVFYIGDSKYYKNAKDIEKNETNIYKQYTYASNVINRYVEAKQAKDCKLNKYLEKENIILWDSKNRSYHPLASFFVIPYMKSIGEDNKLFFPMKKNNELYYHKIYHYKNRVFDRNTFYVMYFYIDLKQLMEVYINNLNIYNIQKSFRDMIMSNSNDLYHQEYKFELLDEDYEGENNDGRIFKYEKIQICGLEIE